MLIASNLKQLLIFLILLARTALYQAIMKITAGAPVFRRNGFLCTCCFFKYFSDDFK